MSSEIQVRAPVARGHVRAPDCHMRCAIKKRDDHGNNNTNYTLELVGLISEHLT